MLAPKLVRTTIVSFGLFVTVAHGAVATLWTSKADTDALLYGVPLLVVLLGSAAAVGLVRREGDPKDWAVAASTGAIRWGSMTWGRTVAMLGLYLSISTAVWLLSWKSVTHEYVWCTADCTLHIKAFDGSAPSINLDAHAGSDVRVWHPSSPGAPASNLISCRATGESMPLPIWRGADGKLVCGRADVVTPANAEQFSPVATRDESPVSPSDSAPLQQAGAKSTSAPRQTSAVIAAEGLARQCKDVCEILKSQDGITIRCMQRGTQCYVDIRHHRHLNREAKALSVRVKEHCDEVSADCDVGFSN